MGVLLSCLSVIIWKYMKMLHSRKFYVRIFFSLDNIGLSRSGNMTVCPGVLSVHWVCRHAVLTISNAFPVLAPEMSAFTCICITWGCTFTSDLSPSAWHRIECCPTSISHKGPVFFPAVSQNSTFPLFPSSDSSSALSTQRDREREECSLVHNDAFNLVVQLLSSSIYINI